MTFYIEMNYMRLKAERLQMTLMTKLQFDPAPDYDIQGQADFMAAKI